VLLRLANPALFRRTWSPRPTSSWQPSASPRRRPRRKFARALRHAGLSTSTV